MADDLTGSSAGSTYTTLTKIDGGITGSLTALSDGDGTESALQISTTAVNINGTFSISSNTLGLGANTTISSFAATFLDDANAAAVRTTLGIIVGTDVQAYDQQLDDIAGLTPTDNGVIIGNGTNFVVESGATLKTSLGLAIGTDIQAHDSNLDAIAGLTSAANKLPYFTGDGTAAVTDLTSEGRSIIALTDPGADRIVFWDDSAGSYTHLTVGSGLVITDTTLSNTGTSPTWSTFSPTVTLVGGAGNTVPVYSTNSGRYATIGKVVMVQIALEGDGGNEGAGTGQVNIALPTTAGASLASRYRAGGYAYNGASNFAPLVDISQGGTTLRLVYLDASLAYQNFTGNNQNNSSRGISLNFSYEID